MVKLKFKIDPDLDKNEIVLSASELNKDVQKLQQLITEFENSATKIEVYRDEQQFYLELAQVLFFETDSKLVMAHTTNESFAVKHKLYELEQMLPSNFMRISKSAILNLNQIYSLTKSISSCRVTFHDSYKTVFISRRYYKELKTRINERRYLK